METQDDFFTPITTFPPGRLCDIMEALETKKTTVLNLDASLPRGKDKVKIFRTILYKLSETPSVKTVSMRFNTLGEVELQLLVDWLATNDTVEQLYLLCTRIPFEKLPLLDEAWKKHLRGHRVENNGYTLVRVPLESVPAAGDTANVPPGTASK